MYSRTNPSNVQAEAAAYEASQWFKKYTFPPMCCGTEMGHFALFHPINHLLMQWSRVLGLLFL